MANERGKTFRLKCECLIGLPLFFHALDALAFSKAFALRTYHLSGAVTKSPQQTRSQSPGADFSFTPHL